MSSAPSSHSPRRTTGRWGVLRSVLQCCTHCGYPSVRLCCFGCRYQTRVIFIGAGGVFMGFWYFMLLTVIIICAGARYILFDPTVTLLLVLGCLYLPMGLVLIFSAQKKSPLLLPTWIWVNSILAVVDFVLMIVYVAHAEPPGFCSALHFNLAIFFLEFCIKVSWCYCIAVVTQYRHKLQAINYEARRQPSRDGTY